MTTLAKTRYRLPVNAFVDQGSWIDALTSKQLKIPAGVDVQIEVGIMESGSTPYDLTNVANITLEVKALVSGSAPAAGAAALMADTITTLDAMTFTAAQWAATTAQHVTFVFADTETNIAIGPAWLVISAVMDDGSLVSLGWGQVEIVQDGTGPTSTPAVIDPDYVTTTQLDAYRTLAASTHDLRDFTGLTGGTATDLDSIATTALAVNSKVAIVISGALQFWRLQAGTNGEAAAQGIVRPDDYATTSNEKIWIRVL